VTEQQVDIPRLTAIGGDAGESAASLAKAAVAHTPHLEPGTALAGWGTGTRLSQGVRAWSSFLKALHTEVETFGTGLVQSAREYAAADAAAAGRINRAGGPR
jgi:hypothetical protein